MKFTQGMTVSGQYLGHAFTGKIHRCNPYTDGGARVELQFDSPVDVVESQHFSAFRSRVSAEVNAQGVSAELLSNGTPQLQILETGAAL